jgi:hypothetical protein
MRDKLSSIFLSPEVFIELFIEFILLLVVTFTLFQTLYVLRYYLEDSTTELQYKLEQKSYLIGVVVTIVLSIKIVLIPFFAYSMQELSSLVSGAMCAAGVINSNSYGTGLLFLKLLILFFALIWLLLNKADFHMKKSRYFRKKLWLFMFLYLLILLEFIGSLKFFTLIEIDNPVVCCSVIYTKISNPIPFNLSITQLLILFYSLYFIVIYSAYKNKKNFLIFSSLFFVYSSYYALVYFFATYIYELPTHKCPYCMLQKDYYYVGYFIYITLFLGIYSVLKVSFDSTNSNFNKVILFFSIFVLILSSYFLIYIIKNGVLL